MSITLRALLQGLTAQPVLPLPVMGVACHSKQVRAGEVFVAIRGPRHDGHQFLAEAAQRGACAVVVEQPPAEQMPCPVIVLPDTKRAMPTIAARWYGEPAKKLRAIGVTGTNGKTTTTYLLKAILEASGQRVGMLGTVAYEIGQRHLPSVNTTPGALDLQRLLADMVQEGLSWSVMEVSSHALDQRRIEGLAFDAAIFTNLGSDHLDYHKTRERYAEAKRRLFDYLRPEGRAVLNADDPYGRALSGDLREHPVLTYGLERPAQVFVRRVDCGWQGTDLVLESPWGIFAVSTPLIGRHNVLNIAAACGTCLSLGVSTYAVQHALANFVQVPGRLECVANDAGIQAVVDYAHTADALRLVLLSLRELVRGRLIVVFGCGGDRDRTKRPVMGQIASLLADQVILTADNPRSEDPMDIIRHIKQGLVPGFQDYQVIADREQAITTALALARTDDAVLIAGKGHEAYQVFDHITVPFSDREVVERYFTTTVKAIAV